jgi:hypothetical protein
MALTGFLPEFDPLANNLTDDDLRQAYEMSRVRTVIDSYHGRIDALAEAIQNSVDALEERWAAMPIVDLGDIDDGTRDAVPRLRIDLDFDANAAGVLDNGIGIPPERLPTVLEPFVSPKRLSLQATRGHKGVGTTFLAYGHPRFEIHTKITGGESVAYEIVGGRAWATSAKVSQAPKYQQIEPSPALQHYACGTYVRMFFDRTTTLRDISRLQHNTAEMWREILRTNTALGQVVLNTAPTQTQHWTRHLQVAINHPDGAATAELSFPFPHWGVEDGRARELQWLQNYPGAAREFELIYVERNHDQLLALLASDIDELEGDEDPEKRDIAVTMREYEVQVYASLAYKNTFYEEQFRRRVGRPDARNFSLASGIGGGVTVSSVGMPMGGLQSHLMETMQPQERRRYFLLLHFNDKYSPDAGRKTIPQHIEPVVEFLEDRLLKLLRTQSQRLLRDREGGVRPTGAGVLAAQEEIRQLEARVVAAEAQTNSECLSRCVIRRTPLWEEEVVAIFVQLVSQSLLIGYSLRGIPGTSGRYDMLFDYEMPVEAGSEDFAYGLNEYRLQPNGISLTGRWAEFKIDVNSLVADLESEDADPGKKYFSHLDLAIVWRVSPITSDRYALEELGPAAMGDRTFFGSTHVLKSPGSDRSIEVIELSQFVDVALEAL